jgi:hypothetical protein
VRSLGVDSLRTLWRTTFRSSPPPAFSKDILARGKSLLFRGSAYAYPVA